MNGGDGVTVAWFHCFSGIAGDMTLGALVDAGANLDEVRAMCERLDVGGWTLEATEVLRGGIGGTKVHVGVAESPVVRTAGNISALVAAAGLPPRVEARALAAFDALAAAEGRLHRRPPEQVHFHEVGGVDAIIDVVGSCAALELLGVDRVVVSPVATGRGMVRSAHGLIPNPAPATVELLRDAPVYGLDESVELTTPTGAALAATLAHGWGPMPAMRIGTVGFGAGDAELDGRPNLLQVVVGEVTASASVGVEVVQLEVNVDDATGEVLADTIAAALDAGALDAWVTPIVMKKGRPAHTVSALVDPSLAGQVADVLTTQTGSFGIRAHRPQRSAAPRRMSEVDVDGHPVRIKVGPGRAKPEYEDAARVARRTGRPLREVLSLAEEGWRRSTGSSGDGGVGAVENHDDPHAHRHGHPHDH
jgi:uncharacterized protein (TIGR00299 family) protein